MKHLLSVIIPLYNSEKYIEKCIDSVLELHISKEIIVIDDGSTDNSYKVVKSYADNGLIKLYQQENKGVSEARNHGLSVCSGDIIAFVDSDDYIIKQGFEDLYHQFLLSGAELAMGGVVVDCYETIKEYRHTIKEMYGNIYTGQQCYELLMKSNTFIPSVYSYLYKKSFVEQHNLKFNYRMAEDDLWSNIAICMAESILISDKFHYLYNKHTNSLIGINKGKIIQAQNYLCVAKELYIFSNTYNLNELTRLWLYSKILYLTSLAVKIYAEKGDWDFRMDLQMYQDIFKRLLSSTDEYVKKIGLMFGGRIIKMIKQQ